MSESTGKKTKSPSRSLRARLLLGFMALFCALLFLEGMLQLLGLFYTPDRSQAPGAQGIPILCVGDSHTYGLNVPAPLNYPNRLHACLNRGRAQDRYQVISRGVPGRNSAIVREKLPAYLEQIDPYLVLLLCGFNNSWNSDGAWYWDREEEGFHPGSLFAGLKLVKLTRLLILNLKGKPEPEEFRIISTDGNRLKVREGGEDKLINPGQGSAPGLRIGDELERVTAKDLRACVRICRDAGAVPVILTYAPERGHFTELNRAARTVAREMEVPLIDQAESFKLHLAAEEEELLFFEDLHLKPRGYQLAAADIAARLMEMGLVQGLSEEEAGANGPALPDPATLQLSLHVEQAGPEACPEILLHGARGVSFQLIFSLAVKKPDPSGNSVVERHGIEMDELAGLTLSLPTFNGIFTDEPECIKVPRRIAIDYAGQTLHALLLAVNPRAVDPLDSVLGTVPPVTFTLPAGPE